MAQLNDLLVLGKSVLLGSIKSNADHDLISHSNEFTFASPGYNTSIYINYRTSGGTDGSIAQYRFCNGDGKGTLAPVYASTFYGALSGNASSATMLTSSAGSSTLPVYFTGGKPTAITNIELSSTSTGDKYVKTTNSNGSVGVYTSTNRGLYDFTKSAWIVYNNTAGDHTYIPLWKSKGSATLPVYFNSSGEPVACNTSLAVSISGNAATATALTSNAGSSTLPIYFNGGKPVACSTTLGVSITGNAATATLARKVENSYNSDSSNYKDMIIFHKADGTTIQQYIGGHNTGNTNGAIIINPAYDTSKNRWDADQGFYIGKTALKWNGNTHAVNSAPTLAWGSTSTIGTIFGTALTVKMPANPNVDTKVTQSSTTTSNFRPVILGYTNTTTVADLAATTTNQVYASTKFYAKPSTGALYATTFVGALSGNATTATSANALANTGYGNGNFTWYQTSGEFAGNSGWASYLISNHGDGSNYYHQIIAIPFWGAPKYRRMEGSTSTIKGWYDFITDENYTTKLDARYYTEAEADGRFVNVTGDSMSGTLSWGGNISSLNFRTGHANYDGVISYQTSGNEAMLFTTKNAVTSFMFVNGEDTISNISATRWTTLTPGLQIKNNCVAIGKLIANDSTPSYKLEVAGMTYSSGRYLSETVPSSWIDGQRYDHGAYNVNTYSNDGSYNPWMRATNNHANVAKWFSFGTLGKQFYWVGSATSRTSNGYDKGMIFDVESGLLYAPIVNGDRIYTGYDSGVANSVSCSNWFRSNGDTGWYNASHGTHIRPNIYSSYGSVCIHGGAKGGYEGLHFGSTTSGMTVMSIDGSHQGLYNQSKTGWIIYADASTGLVGVGASSTNSGYKVTISGNTYNAGSLYMANNNITGVNSLHFADPGPDEGITWDGGNGWKIQECPDNLANSAGNLQFMHGSTRRITINTDGYVDINCRLVVRGNGSSYNEGIRILPASNGWSNVFFSANTTLSDTHDGGWLIGRRGAAGSTAGAIGDFTIEEQNSNGSNLTIHKDNNGATLQGMMRSSLGYQVQRTSGDGTGLGFYGTSPHNSYGIHMSYTSTYGKFGTVQGDWATYFCFDGATNRGWIFKHAGTNVASINGLGQAFFKGTFTCNRGYSTSTSAYADSAMEIREYGFGGAQSDTWGVAPRLSFHWSGRVAAQIGLASNGNLYVNNNASASTTFLRIVAMTGYGTAAPSGAAPAGSVYFKYS